MTQPDPTPTGTAHHAGNAVSAAFTRKIGPLPGWAWLGIVLAGVYGYYYWTHRGGTGTGSTAVPDASFSTDTTGTDTGNTNSGGTLVNGQSESKTNKQWEVLAINALIAHGHNPANSTTAISTYINHPGKELTKNQVQYVNDAIQLVGSPPNPLPISTIPNPGPPPVKKPPPVKHPVKHPGHTVPRTDYRTKSGDTLGSISLQFYGSRSHWIAIRARNPEKLHGKAEQTPIQPNTTIVIPAGTKDT